MVQRTTATIDPVLILASVVPERKLSAYVITALERPSSALDFPAATSLAIPTVAVATELVMAVAADKHPWLRSLGSGPHETKCPVLADPSCTTSADYGVVRDDSLGLSNEARTFIIDREGVIRFAAKDGDANSGRPSVDQVLKTIDGFKKSKLDEAVAVRDKIRELKNALAALKQAEVEWGGVWWLAEVLEIKNGKYHIHYTGWDNSWDEWVTKDRIRFGTGKETPFPRRSLPRQPLQ
jgi:hypothetical protein